MKMISDQMQPFSMIYYLFLFLLIIFTPMLILSPLLHLIQLNLAFLFPFIMIIVYLLGVSYAFLFLLESWLILKVLYNPKNKEGEFPINSTNPAVIYWALNELLMHMNEKIFSMLLIPISVYSELIFFVFGLKKGKRIQLNPINDPYLTEIGDNFMMGLGALISGHHIIGGKIYIKKIKIGKNVTIGANALISPGAVIEDNVVVGANSFVKKDSVLEKSSFYAGTPAKLIKKI
ncbi:2,3,4,5-tetrahydropyridine-2,6-dicarboxylate N-acetyltransferase [Candidatus Tiddalikarchaeum anstoanum]|nr:2,3,4,5-tetrahydropyridine-2,6-dicarboxylate N-acetyltransferase [Candidatus Tiddalikarchaeum anstoanum]